MKTNFDLTEAMVYDMDSTAEFMHPKNRPQFPTAATVQKIKPERAPVLYRIPGLVTARSTGISVTGQAQGILDAARSAKLRLSNI